MSEIELLADTATLPELTVVELPDGEFCVVSADPTKPLTENQAEAVAHIVRAMKEILGRDVPPPN